MSRKIYVASKSKYGHDWKAFTRALQYDVPSHSNNPVQV